MTLSAATLADNIRFGLRTAREVIETTLHTLETHDQAYGCVTRLLADRALRAAGLIDARIANGEPVGPLVGVPFGVKDLFDMEGIVTTAGSTVLKKNPPAVRDAAVVRRLVAAGAIPVATLNMDEFAYGFATENSHYGTTRNPRDTERLAGGSSGGSAAAVAAGMLPVTLGSDTNGSIRVPAALCGVWGLRPTQGRLPLEGIYPFAASFDTIGPFAGNSTDLKLAFEAMDGKAGGEEPDVGALRVARLGGWFERDLAPGLIDGIDRIMGFLSSTKTVGLPEVARARAAAFIITASEGGNLHLPRLRHQAPEYDPATRDRLMAGALLPASPIIQAHRLRNWFREHLHEVFRETDILIAPATVGPAPRIDQPTITVGGEAVSARANLGLFTQPLTLAGFPILAAPIAPGAEPVAELPLGVQIIAAPGQEQALFTLGAALEHAGLLGYPVRGAAGQGEN
ncbi:AtzE family amidohydrolase [Acetobacter oeni]|uniref:Amidase n=1 Tax=Acetobacter oeni TaxID=304077 RepID=A0A511XIA5_9PROT|nr:AtzE family amidohydrolase [Acetobacter oeni]MBB3881403.1 aspartyl-tRNA(Asn)/glutamyl-tRNA(Gln) amidotransferase subunit A [Acetobacter oeni]NHO18270.1 AtzE family amidohydrolase [Acetobacter oeni]GBR11099.1 amidase [Acetobacter oeni LMG 21952]GEN62680.1 amidase [Acetobacter oeni]